MTFAQWMKRLFMISAIRKLDNEQASLAGNNEEGFVPGIIPAFYRIGGLYKDPNWNGACVFTPWAYYQYYGDEAVLRQAFPVIERYLAIWIARRQMVSWKIMRRWANGVSMGAYTKCAGRYLCILQNARDYKADL